jgi:hypothetical protein
MVFKFNVTHEMALQHLEKLTPPEVWANVAAFLNASDESMAASIHNNTATANAKLDDISEMVSLTLGILMERRSEPTSRVLKPPSGPPAPLISFG